jgi:tripartite-type tricarboxylate transporter receptor subunit TctC
MTMIRAPLLAALALTVLAGSALAQSDPAAGYPNKPIHFVLGFAAGGGTDLLARIVGPKLSDILGQPVMSRTAPAPADGLPSTTCRASRPTATPF